VSAGSGAGRARGIGAVAIGRNEGERLVRCLESLRGQVDALVYVDSGSSDASVARARARGAVVAELDRTQPFSAGRARNLGFETLRRLAPDLAYVQFVDGDCEVLPGWLEAARSFLEAHPEAGVACGRRRERAPDATPWNRLVDMEWNTPVGERGDCGGDALYRAAVFAQAGGFDPALIAGEEPELCLRIRRNGHRIFRIDRDMTLHDAQLQSFRQWWRRQARSGHAYAESVHLHGRSRDRLFVRNLLSILFWSLGPPALALAGAWLAGPAGLLALALYGVLFARVYRARRGLADPPRHAALYGAALVVGKLAELQGAARYAWNRIVRRRPTALIEYKGPS
jgi:GT2 family glycosyltransferase